MSIQQEILKCYTKGKQLTSEMKIEGIGTVRVYGQLDLEKLVKRLLQSKSISG